jgi:hypothetical protein
LVTTAVAAAVRSCADQASSGAAGPAEMESGRLKARPLRSPRATARRWRRRCRRRGIAAAAVSRHAGKMGILAASIAASWCRCWATQALLAFAAPSLALSHMPLPLPAPEGIPTRGRRYRCMPSCHLIDVTEGDSRLWDPRAFWAGRVGSAARASGRVRSGPTRGRRRRVGLGHRQATDLSSRCKFSAPNGGQTARISYRSTTRAPDGLGRLSGER